MNETHETHEMKETKLKDIDWQRLTTKDEGKQARLRRDT